VLLARYATPVTNDLHFGVVVGINRYPGLSAVGDLSFARSDAKRFHEWLVSPEGGGVPKDNTALLRDPRGPGPIAARRNAFPTQRDVNDVLLEWREAVRAKAPPGHPSWRETRIYIYVAGHGYTPPDGVAAMLLADAADDQLGYHLELKRYVDWLVGCAPFREVVVFCDCCRRRYPNAAVSSPTPFATCSLPSPVEVFALIGYAARVGEDALEPQDPVDPDAARGVFTGAVLDGLAGAAATGGEVTSSRLAVYVRSAVEAQTASAPVPQRVEFSGDLSQQIVMCKVHAPPRRKVTLRFPNGASGQAQIKTGAFEPVVDHTLDGQPWTTELEDGLYELARGPDASGFMATLFKVAGEDIDIDAA
jgi:hypothetical protein